jgi:hypothetical protein
MRHYAIDSPPFHAMPLLIDIDYAIIAPILPCRILPPLLITPAAASFYSFRHALLRHYFAITFDAITPPLLRPLRFCFRHYYYADY